MKVWVNVETHHGVVIDVKVFRSMCGGNNDRAAWLTQYNNPTYETLEHMAEEGTELLEFEVECEM